MPKGDVFAMQSSRLNAFLHAAVGVELNGSSLTILSMLARLGLDPWQEAARLAALPRAAATAKLAQDIGQMPMRHDGHDAAQVVAARLVRLLPDSFGTAAPAPQRWRIPGLSQLPSWAPLAIVATAFILGFAVSAMVLPAVTAAPAPHSTQGKSP